MDSNAQCLEEVLRNNIEDSVSYSLSMLSIEQTNGDSDTADSNKDSGDGVTNTDIDHHPKSDKIIETNADQQSILMLVTTLSYWLQFHVLPTVLTLDEICETLRRSSLSPSPKTRDECDSNDEAITHRETQVASPNEESDFISEEKQEKMICVNRLENTNSNVGGISGNLQKRIASKDQQEGDLEYSENCPPQAKKFKIDS